MPHPHLAALKLGTDPVAPLPSASFHRTLETWLYCPKCDAAYSLIAPYDWAASRWFADESRRHLMLLQRSITRGHGTGHRITHFETNGVAVTAHMPQATLEFPPAPKHLM
jgi:hypothetical protein